MIRAIRPFETNAGPLPDPEAGFGALRTARGCLPLTALEVQAGICGLHAQTVVRQTFHNPFAEAIEATYIFPLPDRAAVTSFRMHVADRIIDGVLRERQDARREYDQAIAEGHRAAIAEEERSGTFSMRVGNLPPGEEIVVELTLCGPLTVARGEAEFRFPLVVAPRYVPGAPIDGPAVGLGVSHDTDQAPDASRVTPPVLLPGFPNPVRLSLEVDFDPAGLCSTPEKLIQSLSSSLHGVSVDDQAGLKVRLQPGERLNRDFILRFAVVGDVAQSTLSFTASADARPGTFALTLTPPAELLERMPPPRDVVFILDRSGSMNGWKMVAARRAVGRLLDTLLEHDRFSVLAFDQSIEFSPETPRRLAAAGNRERWRTIEWLSKLGARGGTEMASALQEGLGLLAASDETREAVIILITDGQVAGEDSLLKTLTTAARIRQPRIHTLGIDQAVNAGFLRRLADLGRGACELVESEERLDDVMDHLRRLIGAPVLRDLRLEPIGWQWRDDSLVPSRMPDVYVDRPVTIFGRHSATSGVLRMHVTGVDAAGRPWRQEVCGEATTAEWLTNLWGRARVRELEDRYASGADAGNKQLSKQIVAVSLEARVLSRFTAYVAVDRSQVVNAGGKPREILQPVELPAGWEQPAIDACVSFLPSAGAMPASPMRSRRVTGFGKGRTVSKAYLRPAANTPATLEEALEGLASALAAFKSRGWFSRRRRCLQVLVDSLSALEALLRAERHPRLQEISALVAQGHALLAQRRSVPRDAIDAFAAQAEKLLGELRKPPEPARAEFWK
jgi:Ca-activated chloride channel family protein